MSMYVAARLVLRTGHYRTLALGLFALAATVYAFTLPAAYTGGVIGLVSLRYLNADLVFFSLALATLLSLTLTMNAYAFLASTRQRGGGLTLGAALSSILPASICCTPLVPTVLAVLAACRTEVRENGCGRIAMWRGHGIERLS